MAKIYTRTGDTGETGLFGGSRVRKDDDRIEAIGAVDELNAALGVVRAELARGPAGFEEINQLVAKMQHRLFNVGAELATPAADNRGAELVTDADVAELEAAIDRFETDLEPLRAFILPGGCPAASQLHLARCVCRRAERRLVALASREPIRMEMVRYLNRLSDLLFVLARCTNRAAGMADVLWQQEKQ